MIRQAITCDICEAEKKQTNHWFVAYEQGGELRVSGWNSRNRLKPGSKHLCGQTCLHKLMDDFMARTVRAHPGGDPVEAEPPVLPEVQKAPVLPETRPVYTPPEIHTVPTDTSLTEHASYVDEFGSSARLIPSPDLLAKPERKSVASHTSAELVRMPERATVEEVLSEEARYAGRNRRSDAWERERAREMRANSRRRSNG